MKQIAVVLTFLLTAPPVFAGGVVIPGGSVGTESLSLGGAYNAIVDGYCFLFGALFPQMSGHLACFLIVISREHL